MAQSPRDYTQVLKGAWREVDQALAIVGDITTSNPSVGDNGAPAPTSSDQVAGQDPSGNLQPLQTDEAGDLKIINVGGSFVPEKFDEVDLAYIPSGNGAGSVGTVTYKLSGATIATLSLGYDGSNNLTSVVRS